MHKRFKARPHTCVQSDCHAYERMQRLKRRVAATMKHQIAAPFVFVRSARSLAVPNFFAIFGNERRGHIDRPITSQGELAARVACRSWFLTSAKKRGIGGDFRHGQHGGNSTFRVKRCPRLRNLAVRHDNKSARPKREDPSAYAATTRQ